MQYCRVSPPFQPNFKFFGVYPLPWWGLQTSAVFQAIPGPEITAVRLYTNAEVLPSLNRNLASGAAGTVNVPLGRARHELRGHLPSGGHQAVEEREVLEERPYSG